MVERYLHRCAVERPAATEDAAQARVRLAAKFVRPALRRMTHLGLLLGSALDGIAIGPDDTVVYASTFAETRALEDFLQSFPAASPLLFQTSIHPGGVQQVLIGRQQPIGRLWPIASGARLVEHALQTLLLDSAERVVLLGGEERGTWMLEHDMAAPRPFAFAAEFRRETAGALARVNFVPGAAEQDAAPALETFAAALAERTPLTWRGAGGTWTLAWS
jgi:hypothetical protein